MKRENVSIKTTEVFYNGHPLNVHQEEKGGIGFKDKYQTSWNGEYEVAYTG